jgi:nucleotide-binding universal stress UspA family protein
MIQFKKILVPVDFSEPSKKAVTYGLTLATRFKAKLIVAHIVPESSALTYAFPTDTLEVEKQQRDKASREIQKLVPAEHAAGLDLQTVVKTGHIDAELLRMVKDEAIDLVIMGTHGRRYLGRWFIGSVTEHLLRRVPVPVLTVSHVDTERHAITGPVMLKRIVYATDLSDTSSIGMKYAIEFARSSGAELTVVHVVDQLDRMLWGPAAATWLEGERVKLVQEMRKKLAEFVAREKPSDMGVEALVLEGKPFSRILEFAQSRDMDLIVLNLQSKGILERAFLGSTAERVVRLAQIPVLSIPVVIAEH